MAAAQEGEPERKRLRADEDGGANGEQPQPQPQQQQQQQQQQGEPALDELSTGRPRYRPDDRTFMTQGAVKVIRKVHDTSATVEEDVEALVEALDSHRGCIFESAYEYPGRYARWTMGFQDPPVALEGWGRKFALTALNARGKVLLIALSQAMRACEAVDADSLEVSAESIKGRVKELENARFPEEERSKQNSIFSVVRSIIAKWRTETEVDPQLGLYGAFGYDLTFQFEPIELKQDRDPSQRDLALYLPDSILVHDKQTAKSWRLEYDFEVTTEDGSTESTVGLEREGEEAPFVPQEGGEPSRDHEPGEYAKSVEKAREEFKVGNLFEAVISQTFRQPSKAKPSEILRMLRVKNPSPYLFQINLGSNEYLVGASPEMFVRVEKTLEGMRVETCPISGTIQRGADALEDAEQIRQILSDKKEESELTMCTDVDRNDKSRICRQGSVQVIGRRQIEKYSKLIHTVDHVEGYLRDGSNGDASFDALDAFLVHTWAVTVTGAPKTWAIQFLERIEHSPRCWYGGAVGFVGFDGSLNTGMTLRTIRLKDGVSEVRAGATLLYDSVPASEEKETELKASAFVEAVQGAKAFANAAKNGSATQSRLRASAGNVGAGKHVVLIDHQDSFVHTLANYVRQIGAKVTTVRFGITEEELKALAPDMVLMSPGPGKPSDFKCAETLAMLQKLRIPVFGVCLGLQSMVEAGGGTLAVLDYPMHGKPSQVKQTGAGRWNIFDGVSKEFTVARYHSLYANRESVTKDTKFAITAELEDGTVMAVEHTELPMAAVQFHPESILTRPSDGLCMLRNAIEKLKYSD
ncbi:Anthranilate synthase anthranilate synthase component [Hondaea fermentalgiana]|uniref:p-aminobenzoic acid synthase n=1 Tax=Hondaea fermentalgiana TaxID=2315210 RepID=A0A2R5GWI0_9STRA|nr:Anthranilate synthase anthranilate synthase component [Hondaea fermentalgiana]|eukprot:GBG32294.1 Anthranilate synthase anthranilate synthase component [Hondaea fermentalgiana]